MVSCHIVYTSVQILHRQHTHAFTYMYSSIHTHTLTNIHKPIIHVFIKHSLKSVNCLAVNSPKWTDIFWPCFNIRAKAIETRQSLNDIWNLSQHFQPYCKCTSTTNYWVYTSNLQVVYFPWSCIPIISKVNHIYALSAPRFCFRSYLEKWSLYDIPPMYS